MEGEVPVERVGDGVPVEVTLGVGLVLGEGRVGVRVGVVEGVDPLDSVPELLGVGEVVEVPVPEPERVCVAVLLGVGVAKRPVPEVEGEGVGVKEFEK